MRVAILCDGSALSAWQRAAVAQIASDHEIVLLVAHGGAAPRRRLRHAAYYALNLLAIRNRQTRRIPFPTAGDPFERFDFVVGEDSGWAKLSEEAIDWLKAQRVDAVVKFALNLLRIPAAETLAIPILSYHHGDPRAFRGRPAGFYEMESGAKFVGQVVQILSNRLDSGEVLAFAETRVLAHSYRATLSEAYRLSPHMLGTALQALASGERIERAPIGLNYRLPGTLAVVSHVARSLWAGVTRLAYGGFVEKRWRVATAQTDSASPLEALREAEQRRPEWLVPELGPSHRFHADPFFQSDGSLLVEALDRRTAKGVVLLIRGPEQKVLTDARVHYSYPALAGEFVVPEIADWSPPKAFRLGDDGLAEAFTIDIDASRLIDPTILYHEGRVFLFANEPADGTAVLHLWVADALDARFTRHPMSPVRVSGRASRMAGPIAEWDGEMWRFGQDWQRGYGDGLVAFRIVELGPDKYREVEQGQFSFGEVRGPHTFGRRGREILFDYYDERFSPLAAVRRVLARL